MQSVRAKQVRRCPDTGGEQFLPHAPSLTQVSERARHLMAVPAGRRAVLTTGCEIIP